MKIFVIPSTFVLLLIAFALPAIADDETVNATVSIKVISVSVSTNSLAYGTLALGDGDKIPTPAKVIVTNNGNVEEDFKIRGANSAPTGWTLTSGAPGDNTYRHRYDSQSGGTFTAALSGANAALASDVAATSGAVDVFFKLDMPTSSSSTAQQTLPVIITALESLQAGPL